MNRPILSASLSATEFSRWYWLKTELAEFCRSHRLPAGGSKQELAACIKAYLAGHKAPSASIARKSTGSMPRQFTLSSVIGSGWRCSQALRAFFETHVGPGFHFNAAMREFISKREGGTLEEALHHYKQSLNSPKIAIAEQFEYNRHMREFHASNPGTSRAEAVSAWWAKRGQPAE